MGTERTRLTMIEKCKHDWPVQSGNCPECRKEWENAQSSCSSPSACSACPACGRSKPDWAEYCSEECRYEHETGHPGCEY